MTLGLLGDPSVDVGPLGWRRPEEVERLEGSVVAISNQREIGRLESECAFAEETIHHAQGQVGM